MKNVPSVIDGIEFIINGKIKVSSLQLAEKFDKKHENVLKAINNLKCSDSFRAVNFYASSYKTKQNKDAPMYLITRDGYSFLAMGFTGEKAAVFKEGFINAFNKMEDYIIAEQKRKRADDSARLECRDMTDALIEHRKDQGKATKPFHFSNEHNLVYRVALGVTKKKWCEAFDIDKKDRFRDHLTSCQIRCVEEMQRANTMMIEMGMEYKERKNKLETLYMKKYFELMKEESNFIEA